jgi:hypothetical protein
MRLEDLQKWLLDEGIGLELAQLARLSAVAEFPSLQPAEDLAELKPDWPRLLLAAGFLARSDERVAQEAALRVASAGLVLPASPIVRDASAVILQQLANRRSVDLAERRGILCHNVEGRLGIAARIAAARRRLDDMVLLRNGEWLQANRFQKAFWQGAAEVAWVSVSAPTAVGKTYIVLRWLLDRIVAGEVGVAVYLAPTRALVGEVEQELRELSPRHGLENSLDISSLPLKELHDAGASGRRVIFVFTQERLHLLANAVGDYLAIDLLVVDEAHKVGDHLRGVVLQDAVERVVRANPQARLVFISPSTENPAALLEDAPAGLGVKPVDSDTPTVTQNLIAATQVSGNPKLWDLSLRYGDLDLPLGKLPLRHRPVSASKRLPFVAAAVGGVGGTLVYANGAAEAEKISLLIADTALPTQSETDPELADLADLARRGVHPQYLLGSLAGRGAAFHYGNMPSLLRSEIERLFREGKIRFLVCTSTLVEGVNLACRTIVLRGPRKGRGNPMETHDFWNLAGRAGRWGYDFQGNIVCVDPGNPRLWPNGLPRRARFPIQRETDAVLSDPDKLLAHAAGRWDMDPPTLLRHPELEQVSAYLLAVRLREGSILAAPWAKRHEPAILRRLNESLAVLAERVEIPADVASRHTGVSAVGMQRLLDYFRARKGRIEELSPSAPESDDAWQRLIAIFHRVNAHLYPAFWPKARVPVHALVTLEWMRGLPLPHIIQKRVNYQQKNGRPVKLPSLIRETMQHVEEVARFQAPKYLACYLDVLRLYLHEIGRFDLYPDNLRFDLYLEFGVSTRTLLSLIGLGLSRMSAVALYEYIAQDDLDADGCRAWVREHDLGQIDLPPAILREAERKLLNR